MSNYKNRLQSKFKIRLKKGDYLVGQNFNLSDLQHYSQEQDWNFLREFDQTPRRLRQKQLNHYKKRLTYLSIFASNINPITLNQLRDQIVLLDVTFKYTIRYQSSKRVDESQITYYMYEEIKYD